jgi:hypothetical protein
VVAIEYSPTATVYGEVDDTWEQTMNKPDATNENKPRSSSGDGKGAFWGILFWPLIKIFTSLDKHFISYIMGRVRRDSRRIYAVRFVWYGDSVYLHPMIWGGFILAAFAYTTDQTSTVAGWILLSWFILLFVCFLTIMYNFDVIKSAVMLVGVIAILGLAYIANMELAWNPLTSGFDKIKYLGASVSPGFYMVSGFVFALMIASEIIWAWLFHRVEIDESYVYEHRFLRGTEREPIFARGLKRETKDLLELLLLGAADISHRTRRGFKRFKNVPFASLWLGTAIDSMLDHRRRGEEEMGAAASELEETDQVTIDHALPDDDDGGDVDQDDADDAGDPM